MQGETLSGSSVVSQQPLIPQCRLCGRGFCSQWTQRDAKSNETLTFALCGHCSLVQQRDLPTDESLKIYYSHHYREDYKSTHQPRLKHVYRAGRAALDRLRFMQRAGLSGRGQSLLDIGAGGGEFCYLAHRAGFKARGIEPHHGYSAHARDAYQIQIDTMGVADLQDAQADIITMFHVFEHLAHPRDVMAKLWSVLVPDGHLIIEVPNIHQADASPHNIYFKAHLFYYSRHSLLAAASSYFDCVHVEDEGNLFVALRRRPQPIGAGQIHAMPAGVMQTQDRLQQKGWLEYLTVGGGLMKWPRRLEQYWQERRAAHRTPLQILDELHAHPPRKPTGLVAIGLLATAVVAMDASV